MDHIIYFNYAIGHWNSLHLKVSQGWARKTCHMHCISIIISISLVSSIKFEASFMILVKDKVTKNAMKNAQKHEIVLKISNRF